MTQVYNKNENLNTFIFSFIENIEGEKELIVSDEFNKEVTNIILDEDLSTMPERYSEYVIELSNISTGKHKYKVVCENKIIDMGFVLVSSNGNEENYTKNEFISI